MKTLILIDGQPKSGKTRLAESLVYANRLGEQWEKQSVTHWEPNFYFYDAQGNHNFDAEKWPQAHTQCKVVIKAAMKRGDNVVIVSHHFNNFWQKKYYLNLAKQYDYGVQEIFLRSRFQDAVLTLQLVESVNQALAA